MVVLYYHFINNILIFTFTQNHLLKRAALTLQRIFQGTMEIRVVKSVGVEGWIGKRRLSGADSQKAQKKK